MPKYQVGDLVWAKMKSYQHWPAKIVAPPDDPKSSERTNQYYVCFFGPKNFAWVMEEMVEPHNDDTVQKYGKKKSATLQKAINEIIKASFGEESEDLTSNNNVESSDEEPKQFMMFTGLPETPKRKKIKDGTGSLTKKKAHKSMIASADSADASFDRMLNNDVDTSDDEQGPFMTFTGSTPESSKRRKISDRKITVKIPRSEKVRKVQKKVVKESDEDVDEEEKNFYEERQIAFIRPYDGILPNLQSILTRPDFVERPGTPPFEISQINENMGTKKITPSDKKIGFLGLGHMGRIIAKNFLNSGHDLTVWNGRMPEKCDDFVDAGAKKGLTPSDVVSSCDITFCCMSDALPDKSFFEDRYGLLKGFEVDPSSEDCDTKTKGYVELRSLSPESSKKIEKDIVEAGGKYLEAAMCGDRTAAAECSLIIVASGNKDLYDDCKSLFDSVAKHVHYLGPEVGQSSILNLAHNALVGCATAALGEAVSLLVRLKIPINVYRDLLKETLLSSPLLQGKLTSMNSNSYGTETAIKYQQKDLDSAMALSEEVNQPLYITSAANELFKHAKQLRYSDHDISAVYFGAKY